MSQIQNLTAIVLDWAGTMIDHGSRAPASVFQEIFRRRGVEITVAQARGPMGMAKREHIAAVGRMPEVAAKWEQKFGSEISDGDVDSMYADFLPLQKSTLGDHCEMIDGTVEAVRQCRELGLKIGSSTGYTHELMEVVAPAAKQQGYEPDCILCSEDAPRGRPAPYLLFEAAKRMDVFPMSTIVKVDDTPVGIEAGRNAGCWTVGVTRTGNGVGLSKQDVDALSEDERTERCAAAERIMREAGAHFVIESVAEIVPLVLKIDQQMCDGQLPY